MGIRQQKYTCSLVHQLSTQAYTHTWTTNNVESKQYPRSCNKHTETEKKSSEEPDTSS